jgi:hypothetical protein
MMTEQAATQRGAVMPAILKRASRWRGGLPDNAAHGFPLEDCGNDVPEFSLRHAIILRLRNLVLSTRHTALLQ